MKWMMGLVVVGYLFLIVTLGWLGLVAAVLHIAALLLFVKRP